MRGLIVLLAFLTLGGCMTVSDLGGLTRGYAELFIKRGGTFVTGNATSLRATAGQWQVESQKGLIVVGKWAKELDSRFHGRWTILSTTDTQEPRSLTVMQPPSVKKASNTIRPRIPLSRWPATKNRRIAPRCR